MKKKLNKNIKFDIFRQNSSLLSLLKRNVNFAVPALGVFDPLLDHLARVYSTRGKTSFLSYNKAVRGSLMNYLSGNPSKIPGVGITSDGIPICLGPIIPYIRNIDDSHHISVLSFTMTILGIGRALKDKPAPDFDSITHPNNGVEGYKIDQHVDLF
jgi:hypothetical protein